MNERIRRARIIGNLYVEDIDWLLRVYLMLGIEGEVIERDALFRSLEERVRIVAANYLSTEFEYIRSGFILAHYGRRGVTYSIWHLADWGGTWEYFCQAWYCYGRCIEEMVSLDRSEPILCQHEIDVVVAEAATFRNIVANSSRNSDITCSYRRWSPEIATLNDLSGET